VLRMNVAPDVYAKGSWVVHLYANAGDEHIYHLRAVSATNAARIALEGYEANRRAETRVVSILSGGVVDPIQVSLHSDPQWR
jgi:hypothetical protein